jgi:mitochondrial import inner membrane translocase subunit TIM44
MAKNKDMKDNIKKFREEAEKLEHSDALQKARQKFQSVESEASKGSEVFKEKFDTIKDKMGEVMEEAGKTDIAKKAGNYFYLQWRAYFSHCSFLGQFTEGIGKSARGAAESISATGQKIGKTQAYQTFTQTATAVKKELDQSSMQAYVYKRPTTLRKRKEHSHEPDARVVEPNMDATGMELHKDSKYTTN